MNNNNNLEELVYLFDYDLDVLEMVNSVASITKDDDSFYHYDYEVDDDLDDLESITFWDMSKMTALEGLFEGNEEFNELLLWNTKNVEVYDSLFFGATSYNQPLYWHCNPREGIETIAIFMDADSLEEKNKPELFDVRLAEAEYWWGLTNRYNDKFGDLSHCIKERPLEDINERINRIKRFGGIYDW